MEYCKTPNFGESLIFMQINEGIAHGVGGMHGELWP